MRRYGDGAVIAAVATPPGASALAVIRVSGNAAVDLLAEVFSRPDALRSAPGNTVVYGWILDGTRRIDETLVSVYRAPRSYTGEEGADIACHGGSSAVLGILRVLRGAGFQDALPGEFTFRAFMNRKLDLTKAESVMELVSAKTDRARDRAVLRLSGQLEREIQEVKSLLMEVLAGTELFLDYSEDEFSADSDETAGRLPHRGLAETAFARLSALAESHKLERLYRDGALAVIAGRPNAGKSSLFNGLVREDRSIVSAVPGTTRDWIEAWVSFEGVPVRLADTAGLRDSADEIERLGVARTRSLAETADVILYVLDGAQGITPEDAELLSFFSSHNFSFQKEIFQKDFFQRVSSQKDFFKKDFFKKDFSKKEKKLVAVWNKADIAPLPAEAAGLGALGVSAMTGAGLSELIGAVVSALTDGSAGEDGATAGVASERQKSLIGSALDSLREALILADQGQALDLIAPALRSAVDALGEITGEVSSADILEVMFSKFCVGK
ncbi:MAG: tRNA uridine-5-carboxymethylaminomethyl(34) synthesis GTPase MnmE [Spirochaetaceae bacterium]|jgi:tRNA modification GTPase|nr:tRNA uridine-5-carboxymethylaminomethyl(34) synthesis GTPase MnmE [Spirochaetaceae bacterium]